MKIILFRGRPGAGKTTVSNICAKRMNLPVLRKDDIYDVVAESVAEHTIRSGISYCVLYKILESNAGSNATFVLDYPFHHPGDMEKIRVWCRVHKVILKSILVTCSDENVWAERLRERAKNPAPNQLLTDFESFKKLYGTMQLISEADELCIDTVYPIEDILSQVTEFVSV
jgi:predicted kinase